MIDVDGDDADDVSPLLKKHIGEWRRAKVSSNLPPRLSC